MHLVRNHSHNFGTLKYYIQDQNTSFASFHMRKVYKVLQTTPKHNFGTRDWNESIWWKMIFAISVPRNSAFMHETQVLHLFT
jgi:hypothetical protein